MVAAFFVLYFRILELLQTFSLNEVKTPLNPNILIDRTVRAIREQP